jgi:TonB family protein
MRWTRVAGCIGGLLLALVSMGERQAEPPAVIHPEVPDCFAGFMASGIHGTVVIRVTLDRDGKVTTSTVEHSLPIVTRCAEAAARKWIFVPSDREDAREALLSFIFTGVFQQTDEPGHMLSSFDDPWTVRLGYARSNIRWLPRVNGRIPEKRCPVHGEVMAVEVVSAEYGLPMMRVGDEDSSEEQRRQAERDAYLEARAKLFPETNRVVRGGCIVHELKQEMYYCRSCREAELAWLAKHPGFKPDD